MKSTETKTDIEEFGQTWYELNTGLANILFNLCRVNVEGADAVKDALRENPTGHVVSSNHRGELETALIPLLYNDMAREVHPNSWFESRLRPISKPENFQYRLAEWWLEGMGAWKIHRNRDARHLYPIARTFANGRHNILFFPQGHRGASTLKPGLGYILHQAQELQPKKKIIIVPTYVEGSCRFTEFFPELLKGIVTWKRPSVNIKFGTPKLFSEEEYRPKLDTQYLRSLMSEMDNLAKHNGCYDESIKIHLNLPKITQDEQFRSLEEFIKKHRGKIPPNWKDPSMLYGSSWSDVYGEVYKQISGKTLKLS